jgi:hypothetical protein
MELSVSVLKSGIQKLKKTVAEQLNQLLGQQIEPSQVKVFPFDSARLISKWLPGLPANFLTNEWLPYHGQVSFRFTLICPTREDCRRVKGEMQSFPEKFEDLQLEFKLNDSLLEKPKCSNVQPVSNFIALEKKAAQNLTCNRLSQFVPVKWIKVNPYLGII